MFSVCFICIAMTLVRFLSEMDSPGTIFVMPFFNTLARMSCVPLED